MSPWYRKAVALFVAAGVGLGGTVGIRLWQFHRATRENRNMLLQEVPVRDLDGGFVVRPVRRGYRLVQGPGRSRLLQDGEQFLVGETRFTFHQLQRGERKLEVLAIPLRVYAARETTNGPRGGFRRIDIGGDPIGARTGIRDRVYVDHQAIAAQLEGDARARFDSERGIAHLKPHQGEVFRLSDRAFDVVAEVPGLALRDSISERALVVGEPTPLASDARLVGLGLDLQFAVEDRLASSPITGSGGQVIGHRSTVEPVVAVYARTEDDPLGESHRAWLTFADRDGLEISARLPSRSPALLYGEFDRFRPMGGHVIPPDLEHQELRERFAEGVKLGAIRQRRGFLELAHGEPSTRHFLDGLSGGTEVQMTDLIARYNHAEAAADVVVHGSAGGHDLATATGWHLQDDEGQVRPAVGLTPDAGGLRLAPPGEFDPAALEPGTTTTWGLVRTLTLDEPCEGILELASSLPATVRVNGEALRETRNSSARFDLKLPAGETEIAIELRYRGRPAEYGQVAGVRVNIGGQGPQEVRVSRRRFAGWQTGAIAAWQEAQRDPEGRLWLPGERPLDTDVTGYLQLVHHADRAGHIPLSIHTEGRLEAAWLNGVSLDAAELPFLPGESADLELDVKRGTNVLALRVRQPAAQSQAERGGVELSYVGGALVGLHPRTDRRRMTLEPASPGGRPLVSTSDHPRPVRLVVSRGTEGLPSGSEWMLDQDGSLLWLPGDAEVSQTTFTLDQGIAIRCDARAQAPFEVVNRSGQSVSLYRQLDPRRRPYRPFSGFAVHEGWAHPLTDDRDAIRWKTGQLTYRAGHPTGIAGHVSVVRADGIHRLIVDRDGPSRVSERPTAGDFLVAHATVDGVTLLDAAEGTAIYRDGFLLAEAGETDDLPIDLRQGDAISCPSSGVMLIASDPTGALQDNEGALARAARNLSSGRPRRGASPGTRLTLEPRIQRVARDELRAQIDLVKAIHEDADLEYQPGPDGLEGAVVLMDAIDGRILVAVAAGEEIDASGAWGLSWHHPGSTFKIVTGLAALASDDPQIHAMLRGELPPGLLKATPGSLAGAEVPPLAPDGGRWAGEGGEAIRVRARMNNHGRVAVATGTDLGMAYQRSYNVFFGYLALMLHRPLREGWADAGIASERELLLPLAGMADRLGFGEVLDLVPSGASKRARRSPPLLDDRGRPVAAGDALVGWTGRFPDGLLDDPQMAACGVGQGEVYATPLQMARVVAAVANGGQRVQPSVVTEIDGRVLTPDAPIPIGLSEDTLDEVRQGLRGVITGGTAETTFCDNPYRSRIWGKTGSAERPAAAGGHVTDSWFVGVMEPPEAHADDHAIAFACVLPGAGLGATHAAEVVDRLSRFVARERAWKMDP